MVLTVTITRKKIHNNIIEVFNLTPNHPYLINVKRKASKFIWKFIHSKSIANKYKLLYILPSDYSYTLVMQFEDKPIDFKLNEIYRFDYHPVLGKKTCAKCTALKIFNNKMYCRTKSKQINKNSWYRCQEWQENTEIAII
jgi:hypothetical protein